VILHCLEDSSLRGPVNASAPTPVTDTEFAHALGDALHRPAVLAAPGFALRLALGREMATELLLIGQRALPAALSSRGFRFSDEVISSALEWALADRR